MTELCSLYSGSSGNCIYVGNDDSAILIDAGVSGSRILNALEQAGKDASKLKAIFVSHEHGDHVKGVGIISRKLGIPIYANRLTWLHMRPQIGKIAPEMQMPIEDDGHTVHIGSLEIQAFSTPHDSADPQFYSVYDRDNKVTVCTDIGNVSESLYEKIKGSNAVLLESNHDVGMLQCGPYPYYLKQRIISDHGHLSNDDAAANVLRLTQDGTKHFILGHLSKENNYPDIARMTAETVLKNGGVDVNKDISLEVASREGPGRTVCIPYANN
ncbi:MAG: MBL fold metallo-hydrolase [Clostridia bacterium]|nr:MBL fold metallo-hydrolase [Clostridia bacterium]